MQNDEQVTTSEISLKDAVHFFKRNQKTIMLGCLVGLLLAAAYVVLMPKKYEARWQMQMAKFVSNSNSFSFSEEPAALIQRLRLPSMYSLAVRQSCDLDESEDLDEYLNGILKANVVKNVPDLVEMKIVSSSSEQATKCAEALAGMIADQQRGLIEERLAGRQAQLVEYRKALVEEQKQLEKLKNTELGNFGYLAKLDQLSWLRSRIDGLQEEIVLSRLHPAKLTAPFYVPSKPVSPKVGISLVLGVLMGLMIGLLYVLGREGWRKAS